MCSTVNVGHGAWPFILVAPLSLSGRRAAKKVYKNGDGFAEGILNIAPHLQTLRLRSQPTSRPIHRYVFTSCHQRYLLLTMAKALADMPQVSQHNIPTARPAPITMLPTEVLTEIFKTYVESYPDKGPVDLCLVGKYWNAVANATPQLWTNIRFSFPFTSGHLIRVLKWVRASKLQKIDVLIDFRDPSSPGGDEPEYDEGENLRCTNEFVWVQGIMTVLKNTEERWKSIKVVSDTWLPLYRLMDRWKFTHLSSLESILMERDNNAFGARDARFEPRELAGPMTLFGRNASLPKLHELSLFAVHVDWKDASVCYQNLRKLEIKNQTHDVGPTFEQFAAILASSPRLEYLDVSGFCPEDHTEPAPPPGGAPKIPIVRLPVLKDFVFGWKDPDTGCPFLRMFQIGDSLESLTLMDTESGFGDSENWRGCRIWSQESQAIFEALYELGSAVPGGKDSVPSGPFISLRGVKRLKIVWTKTTRFSLTPFLMALTEVEDIWLEDVKRTVLEDVVRAAVSRAAVSRPLRRLDLRWRWQNGIPRSAGPFILQTMDLGVKVTAR
jgi:hypothetical protein